MIQKVDFSTWLQDAVAEVFESMCFLSVENEALPSEESYAAWAGSRLHFQGTWKGTLRLQTPLTTARMIASNLLGEEEDLLEDVQACEAIGEMTNMVCGALLGRLGSAHSFDISAPNTELLLHPQAIVPGPLAKILQLENGVLIVNLEIAAS